MRGKLPAGELKALKTRKSELSVKLAEVDKTLADIRKKLAATERERHDLHRTIASLDKRASELKTRAPMVTEHAILRYLERVLGIDMADVRNELLTDAVRAMVQAGSSGTVASAKGYKTVIKNGVIVTVVGGEFGEK